MKKMILPVVFMVSFFILSVQLPVAAFNGIPEDCTMKEMMSTSEYLCASALHGLILLSSSEAHLRDMGMRDVLEGIKTMQELSNNAFQNIYLPDTGEEDGETPEWVDDILSTQLRNAAKAQVFWAGFADLLRKQIGGELSNHHASSHASSTNHKSATIPDDFTFRENEPTKSSKKPGDTSVTLHSQHEISENKSSDDRDSTLDADESDSREAPLENESSRDRRPTSNTDSSTSHEDPLAKILEQSGLQKSAKALEDIEQNILNIRKDAFGLLSKIFQLGAIFCNAPVGCGVFGELSDKARKSAEDRSPPADMLDVAQMARETLDTFSIVKNTRKAYEGEMADVALEVGDKVIDTAVEIEGSKNE